MKVYYKKIKFKKNWNRMIVDHYYGLSAADFTDEKTLSEYRVWTVLHNAQLRRSQRGGEQNA